MKVLTRIKILNLLSKLDERVEELERHVAVLDAKHFPKVMDRFPHPHNPEFENSLIGQQPDPDEQLLPEAKILEEAERILNRIKEDNKRIEELAKGNWADLCKFHANRTGEQHHPSFYDKDRNR
jgi:hypothetical protein